MNVFLAKDLGHIRKKAGYADHNQESAVDGTGAPGRDQDLRGLARSQDHNWRRTWRARLIGYGTAKEQHCHYSQISLDQRCRTTLQNSGELEFLEQIFGFFGIKDVTPLGFSQQFQAQRSLPNKVFYMKGSLR